MIDSDTDCKYWYIIVGVMTSIKGPKWGQSINVILTVGHEN